MYKFQTCHCGLPENGDWHGMTWPSDLTEVFSSNHKLRQWLLHNNTVMILAWSEISVTCNAWLKCGLAFPCTHKLRQWFYDLRCSVHAWLAMAEVCMAAFLCCRYLRYSGPKVTEPEFRVQSICYPFWVYCWWTDGLQKANLVGTACVRPFVVVGTTHAPTHQWQDFQFQFPIHSHNTSGSKYTAVFFPY